MTRRKQPAREPPPREIQLAPHVTRELTADEREAWAAAVPLKIKAEEREAWLQRAFAACPPGPVTRQELRSILGMIGIPKVPEAADDLLEFLQNVAARGMAAEDGDVRRLLVESGDARKTLNRLGVLLAVEPAAGMHPKDQSDGADARAVAPGLTRPTMTAQQKRFPIALSFPGERREFINAVANRLAESLGRDRVLYDKYHEAEFARLDLDTHLQQLYHDESDLIAVFLCADYERKEWCGLEWRAIRDLIKRRQASTVMPLRFDDTEIPGLFTIDGYVTIGERTPDDIANLILERLRIDTNGALANGTSTA